MNNADKQYKELLNKILTEGVLEQNRTGVAAKRIAGFMFEHDMSQGFPLLTLRKLPFKSTKVELEFFIKGLRSKKWLQDRGCKYWDQWCNPKKVPYGNDEETKAKMAAEDDLGLVYGTQWRDFHDPEAIEFVGGFNSPILGDFSEEQIAKLPSDFARGKGVDQLKNLVDTLKKNPQDRRCIVSAWNPLVLPYAALPSCHYGFQVTIVDGKLNLLWNQRSVDVCCNQSITTYALLLHLLAKELKVKEGKLIGFLADCHIYSPHLDGVYQVLTRESHSLPTVKTDKFTSVFEWEYGDTELIGYQCGEPISFKVAV